MSDSYAEYLEMQLRFAEEQSQEDERFAYEQGKEDGIRKFAEWLANGNTFIRRIGTDKLTTIDELIAEYEKEQANDKNNM